MRMLRNSATGQNAATDSPPPEPEQRSPLDVAYPVTYYPAATDASGASVITIAPGEKFTADVTLQPVPAVHAKLTVASPDSTEHFSATLKQQVFGDISAPLRTGAREICRHIVHERNPLSGNRWVGIGK